MERVITTADWLRYIESLGPADAESMRLRLESAGATPARAEFLARIARRRAIARNIGRIAIIVLIAGICWLAYQWWLAVQGAANAPDMNDVVIAGVIVGAFAVTLLITSAVELSPPLDLSAFPAIPSELSPPPRVVAQSTRKGAALRLSFAALSFMVIIISFGIPQARNRTWLRQRGVETAGTITSLYTTRGSKGGVTYHMRYAFDRGTGRASLRRSEYRRRHVGDTVPVTYLPTQPAISEARSKPQLNAVSSWVDPLFFVPIVYMLVFFPVLMFTVSSRGRPMQLARNGVATLGEVTRSSRQAIEYRFDDRRGRYFWGKRQVRERPAEGQPLVILYDPGNPRRSVPLAALGDVEFTR